MPKIRLAEVNKIGTELAAEASSSRSALQTVQGEIEDLCSLSAIQGATAVSIKNYFSEVHLPILKALSEISESLPQTYKKMLSQFKSHVDASPDTVIRSEHLGELHKDIDRLKDHFDTIHRQLAADVRSVSDVAFFRVPSADGLTHDVTQQEKDITQLKTHFESFASVNYAGELMPLLNTLEQAMTKIKTSYSPHFGQTNFYQAGSFAKTELGKRLKVKTAQLEKTRQIEKAKKEGDSDRSERISLGIDKTKEVLKALPEIVASIKGLRIVKKGDYIRVTGNKKAMKIFLDRYGHSKVKGRFNVNFSNGQYIRIQKKNSGNYTKRVSALMNESDEVNYALNATARKQAFTNGFKKNLTDLMKPFKTFDNWNDVGYIAKSGKVLTGVGTAAEYASDINQYRNKKMGAKNIARVTDDIATDTVTGAVTSGVGEAVGAASASALAGGEMGVALGPAGMAVGVVAGLTLGFILNYPIYKKKSAIDWAKDGLHHISDKIISWFH
ncbi:MAG: T7SS effector LXG polymorphic toxin [Sporolactobacillus sp.]